MIRIALAAALLLLAHMFYYYPYAPDDTFISLRYAQRLVQGLGLSWNDGEYVEGYSNPLWVLLAAGSHYLGADLLAAVRVMSVTCSLLTLAVFLMYARQEQVPAKAFAMGVMVFALSAPVAIWGGAGMETPLLMLLFAYALAVSRELLETQAWPPAVKAGCALGLICWVRPEGPVYTLAVGLGIMAFSVIPINRRLKVVAAVCGVAFAFFCTLLGWRLAYYGTWVPNTVLAKVTFTALRLAMGLTYTAKAFLSFLPVLLLIRYGRRKCNAHGLAYRYHLFLLSVAGMLSIAVIVVGGDWLLGYRAYLPLVPVAAILVMEACRDMAFSGREKMIAGAALIVFALIQLIDKDNLNARMGRFWVTETVTNIGLELKKRYADTKPLIAVYTAGAIPYYSQLPTLDVYGLNDANLTAHRHEREHFGKGLVGHDLFDASYVESRKPDILLFDIPGVEPLCKVQQCGELLAGYERRMLAIPGYDVVMWVRKP